MADVRDILELERAPTPEVTRESILGEKQKKPGRGPGVKRRPEGMHREVFALLCNDKGETPPLLATDTGQGYAPLKARLGMRRARAWAWTPFTNPAREDGAEFFHWRRVTDEPKEYPFARFNKRVQIPTYTETEYTSLPTSNGWTKSETDHLMELANKFDLRFVVMKDRWDLQPSRSVEDLKERYYEICGALERLQNPGQERKIYVFDADHERRRKEQLNKQFLRTPEQLEEEQTLLAELKKIEARKRDRERKTQDLQKLISHQAGGHSAGNLTTNTDGGESRGNSRSSDRRPARRRAPRPLNQSSSLDPATLEHVAAGIKFPDFKNSGVSLRSQRIKLPASVGQKRAKALEQMLHELNIEPNPMATEEICQAFNELRQELVLHSELKATLASCDYEMQSLRHQLEALTPGTPASTPATNETTVKQEIIDVVGSPDHA